MVLDFLKKILKIFINLLENIIRIIGNYFLTSFSNLINNQKLTDSHTCYKGFDSNLFKKINLKEKGFSFLP